MARIKPLTLMYCTVKPGDETTYIGGEIVACTRCRGIGFFEVTGTYAEGEVWINHSTARKDHESKAKRNHTFLHFCAKDTKHPINKKVRLK